MQKKNAEPEPRVRNVMSRPQTRLQAQALEVEIYAYTRQIRRIVVHRATRCDTRDRIKYKTLAIIEDVKILSLDRDLLTNAHFDASACSGVQKRCVCAVSTKLSMN